MKNFKVIEQLLEKWKASRDSAYANFDWRVNGAYANCVSDLEMALSILKQPSNTQMQIDSAKSQYDEYICVRCGETIEDRLRVGLCPRCD